MGTPRIAEISLESLLREGHEVVAVYTREDKPVGRKQVLTAPPVKVRASENNIPVYQPKTLRDGAETQRLANLAPELIVVVAYGLLLPREILDIPTFGCVNLHVSLLPQYRGAAPIQWAVINGEKETGITVMQMDEGLDTGPILAQEKVQIGPDTTSGELLELVASLGGRLLAKTVAGVAGGTLRAVPQSGEGSTAPPLDKKMAELDFKKPAAQLHNLVRGCNPWPLAWFSPEGKKIKVLQAKWLARAGTPGEIVHGNPLTICCGQDALELLHLRPEGKGAMTGAQWATGRRLKPGDRL